MISNEKSMIRNQTVLEFTSPLGQQAQPDQKNKAETSYFRKRCSAERSCSSISAASETAHMTVAGSSATSW